MTTDNIYFKHNSEWYKSVQLNRLNPNHEIAHLIATVLTDDPDAVANLPDHFPFTYPQLRCNDLPNIEAFEQLVRVLDKVPEGSFNLHHWVSVEKCGTTACACGYAAMDPWFQEQGLIWDSSNDSLWFKGYIGFTGVSKLFNIHSKQANWLFSPSNVSNSYRPAVYHPGKSEPSYHTLQQVKDRVNLFLTTMRYIKSYRDMMDTARSIPYNNPYNKYAV